MLYVNQYATAPTNSPLFQNGCTGTQIMNIIPFSSAPASDWEAWVEHLFDRWSIHASRWSSMAMKALSVPASGTAFGAKALRRSPSQNQRTSTVKCSSLMNLLAAYSRLAHSYSVFD